MTWAIGPYPVPIVWSTAAGSRVRSSCRSDYRGYHGANSTAPTGAWPGTSPAPGPPPCPKLASVAVARLIRWHKKAGTILDRPGTDALTRERRHRVTGFQDRVGNPSVTVKTPPSGCGSRPRSISLPTTLINKDPRDRRAFVRRIRPRSALKGQHRLQPALGLTRHTRTPFPGWPTGGTQRTSGGISCRTYRTATGRAVPQTGGGTGCAGHHPRPRRSRQGGLGRSPRRPTKPPIRSRGTPPADRRCRAHRAPCRRTPPIRTRGSPPGRQDSARQWRFVRRSPW